MRPIFYTFIFFSVFFFSKNIHAQCVCTPLPDPTGIIETVSNVSELNTALSQASNNGGNLTILLEDGTYDLANNLLYIGSSMPNLTIRSTSGNRDAVVIKGQGMDGGVSHIFNVAADNFKIADVTIGWVANHAIQIHAESDADFPLIQNVRFVNCREQMLKVSGSSSSDFSNGGVVQCCIFEFPDGVAFQYYTGGIDAHRAKDWEIRNNTFSNIRSPDNLLAEHAIHFWSDSENTLVENNLITNCDRGIGFGLGSSGHVGGIIRNNFVHTSRDVGIGLENCSNAKVYHNTVFTENYFNSIEYRFAGTVNAHIVNNLTTENIAPRDGGTGTVESNFQFYNNSSPNPTEVFVDVANYDFHLAMTVPNITNAGIDLPEVTLDYDCQNRSPNNAPDIGADEFDSMTNLETSFLSKKMKIFPNPNSGILFIENENAQRIQVINLNGKTLLETWIKTGTNTLNLETFPEGVYYLKWFAGTHIGIEKIVVGHWD